MGLFLAVVQASSLLVGFRELNVMVGIKPESAACKASVSLLHFLSGSIKVLFGLVREGCLQEKRSLEACFNPLQSCKHERQHVCGLKGQDEGEAWAQGGRGMLGAAPLSGTLL